jgi:hypothetical protein
MRSTIKFTIPLAFCLSPLGYAKNFSIDLSAAVGESDNALKTSENEISEKQNRYTASVKGDWLNEWLAANVQYGATRETFADDSQQGEGYLQGDSQIKLGNAQSIMNLDLRHSRRTLLQDISEAPTTSNQEEREIVSVMPSAHFKMDGSDELVVFSDFSRTRYLETETRDADRDTYGLEYTHGFSAVDSIKLNAKKVESEFLYFPQANYDLHSASVVYQVSLRQLSYSIGAGSNQTEMEAADTESVPHYEASLNYKSGANLFRIYMDQSMTDSSLGQGLDFAVSELPGVDTTATDIGLIKRRSGGIDFSTTAVCARCDLALAVTHTKDMYIDSDSESTQKGASINFRYGFSPQALLLLTHSLSDQEPLSWQLVDQYRQSLSRISFQYKFMLDLSLEIFTEKEKRSSDSQLQDYTENFTGLALAYHFE